MEGDFEGQNEIAEEIENLPYNWQASTVFTVGLHTVVGSTLACFKVFVCIYQLTSNNNQVGNQVKSIGLEHL